LWRSIRSFNHRTECIWCYSLRDSDSKSVARSKDNTDQIESQLVVRHLGTFEYEPVWAAMQRFTDQRDVSTADEFWWVQHPPVFTQGQAGKSEHLLATGDIRVVQVDRGGQVTYHGPGQLVGYLMINLKRRHLGVRSLVSTVEQAIVSVLAAYGIRSGSRRDAPGVYVDGTGAKIAQLGLRVRKGCSFHGLSLNVDMDMEPFSRINPCGYEGLQVTSMANECNVAVSIDEVVRLLSAQLSGDLGYTLCGDRYHAELPT
jgi:lipoyl(octanoyl) transferase